jgi:hypothetical protein
MSGEFKGSSPSQSKHRYLRPRVPFTSARLIGLWHFGQIGGFEVFMARTFRRRCSVAYAPECQAVNMQVIDIIISFTNLRIFWYSKELGLTE